MSESKRPKKVSVINLDKVAGKTYEDGVSEEKGRVLDFLVDSGSQLEFYAKHGKRRYRKVALNQLQAVYAIIEFVDPGFFNENLQDPQ